MWDVECGGCGVVLGLPSFGGLVLRDIFDSWIAVLECLWCALGVVYGVVGWCLGGLLRSESARMSFVMSYHLFRGTCSLIGHPCPDFFWRRCHEVEGCELRARMCVGLAAVRVHVVGILCIAR